MNNKEIGIIPICVFFILFCLVLCPESSAQDTDGDGILDATEEMLGTNPNFAEKPELIYQDKAKEEGDRTIPKDNYSKERDITDIYFIPVAKGRYLWRIDFAAPYPTSNADVILYLDADDDPNTGRKDMPGCDYMFHIWNGSSMGRFIDEAGKYHPYKPPRVAVDGKHLFFCVDVQLNQKDGKSSYRASVLSETTRPHKSVDSTGWFHVIAAGEINRPPIITIFDLERSQNLRVCTGLELIRKEKENPANVVIPIENCQFEGFIHDTRVEYREDSARRTEPKGKIIATVPKAGRWHVGFIFYDGSGDERFDLKVNGKRQGIMVANFDNNRQLLFVLEQPLDLAQGDNIELESLTESGIYRTEDFLLLAELPPAWEPKFEINETAATARWDTASPTVGITWITTWPVKGRVEYGTTSNYGKTAEESHTLNCHRVVLTGLKPNATYHYRIVCPRQDGKDLSTPDATFVSTPTPIRGTARRERLEIEFVRQSYSKKVNLPATGGVPFPKGALGSAENIRLLTPNGDEIPIQTRVTCRWQDGSIKWILLDSQPDFPPNAPARLTLEYGTDVRRKEFTSPLLVKEDPEAITVTTGPARFEVSKKYFGPFGKVWIDANEDGNFADSEIVSASETWGGSIVTDASGNEYTSLNPPDEVVVEESGPLRTVIRVSGRHQDSHGKELFVYDARIHAYAGKPYVRVHYSFCNDNTKQTFTDIQSILLRFPLKERGRAISDVGQGPKGGEFALSQLTADIYEVSPDHQQKEGRLDGWLASAADGRAVGVAIRNFWQLYPKMLAITPKGIEIGICPPLRKEFYQSDGPEDYRLYYYLKTGNYKFKCGCGKRHELLISFGSTDFAADAQMLQDPPILRCPASWYCSTKVFGDIASPKQKAYPNYDALVSKAMDKYLANRERNREYGMLNFGDWWGERAINWGNIEYDTQHTFLIQWVRTGDMRFFHCGEQAARHNMDTDMIRFHPSASNIGAVYAHCIGHVGDYYKQSPVTGKGSPHGGITVSHSWTEGFFDYYFLTGDRRSLEAGLMLADRYDTYQTTNYDFTNCRVPGWHLILTVAAYRATGDPYYLDAAKVILERVLERQTPDGGWKRQMVPGHCYCKPQHHGNAGFMVAVLMTGMKMLHEETGDPRIIDSLVKASHFMLDDMWEDDVKGFRYTSCPKSSAGVWSNFMVFDGILYAYQHTHDPRLERYARLGMDAAIASGISGFGKSFTQQTRAMPYILYEMNSIKK